MGRGTFRRSLNLTAAGFLKRKRSIYGSEANVKNWIAQGQTGRPFRVRFEGRLSQMGALMLSLRTTALPDQCQRNNQWIGKSVVYICRYHQII